MTAFKTVTADFAVAPQLSEADFAAAAAAGYRTIINNRPEGEQPGQMSAAAAEGAARAAGLDYWALPFAGPPGAEIVQETVRLLDGATKGPILAYCRSGTRSITAWAMAQVMRGALSPEAAIAAAQNAGYDLSGQIGALQRLAPR